MLKTDAQRATTPDWEALPARVLSGEASLHAHFQPIVDMRRGTVTGYEGLSRFPADVGEPPDRWFAAAAAHGLGAELERHALATILRHRPALAPNCFLSVNLSPAVVSSAGIQEALLAQGDLRGVVLEITEQTPVEDYALLAEALAPLRARGAQVAIDDAGSGYSSMRHIVALQPQFVKLDRSLIQGVDTDPRKSAAISAIGTFASELDAWVVAEGIETQAELSTVAGLQLPLAQGFLLGRPAPEMGAVLPEAREHLHRQAELAGSGVGALMQMATIVRPGQQPEEAFSEPNATEVAVQVDEHLRPMALLVQRNAAIHFLPVLSAEPGDQPRELALRAMARESGMRFMPAACCDGRGRLLGLIPVERLVESLARG